MKFKGIINPQEFSKLDLAERQLFLIEKKIFEKFNTDIHYKYSQEEINIHSGSEISTVFGNHLFTTLGDFTINKQLIKKIEFFILEMCKNIYDKIFDKKEMYLEQFRAYPSRKIDEIKVATKTNIGDNLGTIFYYNLSKLDYTDFISHIEIIKEFAKYDHKFIYDYLTGLDNKSNYFHINYHNFLLNNLYIDMINEIEGFNSISTVEISLPKKIALIHDLGFLKTNEFNRYSSVEQQVLIAFLLGMNSDKNSLDSIRRNIAVLAPFTNENTSKYTSHKHLGKIIPEILKKN